MTEPSHGDRVVVVGAGIIGIACAYYLTKAGFLVTVIDRGKVAGACSQSNCGYISPSHVLPLTTPHAVRLAMKSLFNPNAPFRVQPRFDLTMSKWMLHFARRCTHRQMIESGRHLKSILDASMTEYRSLIQEEDLQCEWKDNGLLFVLQTARGMDEFSKEDQLLSDTFGVRATRIAGDDLPSFEPALKPSLAGAFHYGCDSSIRPDLLTSQWVQRLKQRGVVFVEDCEVQTIGKVNQRIVGMRTTAGERNADHVVFAMGAWSPHLSEQLGCQIPIQPGKGYSVTMTRPDPCPQYPMLFPEHKVGVSPFENGYRLGSMMEFAGYDTSIAPRRIEQLRTSAEPYLLAPHTETIEQTWYGWRPMTWDSLPIIGGVPGLENAFLATGHNMLGMSLATSTGRLIAEMIQRQPTHINADAFSVKRFN